MVDEHAQSVQGLYEEKVIRGVMAETDGTNRLSKHTDPVNRLSSTDALFVYKTLHSPCKVVQLHCIDLFSFLRCHMVVNPPEFL